MEATEVPPMAMYNYLLPATLMVAIVPASAAVATQAKPAASASHASPAKVLADIQGRINAARLKAVTTNDATALAEIAAELKSANAGLVGQAAYYTNYWLAYADYLLASRRLKEGHRAEAAALLNEASDLLHAIPTADVESYTLLSFVSGLRIAANTSENISEPMREARDAIERAIALDPSNTRVLYARALADYTTPREYGGGRLAEGFARQAIERPAESTRGLRPGWGRDDSAALLIRILRATDRSADASALLARFTAQYPESAPLYQVIEMPK